MAFIHKIYLDYAATTPVDPAVLRVMKPYYSEKFGNAGSLHLFGQEAIAAVDRSRETVAKAIGAEFRDIIFTASATEANNLALRGLVRGDERRETRDEKKKRIIVSSIEHESVLEAARDLEKDGVEVIYLPVDKYGVVDLKKLKESLNENTVLVSVMYVNNEVGVVQPIAEISKIIREFREKLRADWKRGPSALPTPPKLPFRLRRPGAEDDRKKGGLLFHSDASQAFHYFDCDVNALGVDLMTLSSHKIYGPKGAAALCVKHRESLTSIISGGGQEYGLRSGTENVPAIVGFAKAVEMAQMTRQKESKRLAELKHYFWNAIKKIYPKAQINGILTSDFRLPTSFCSPHILNIYFPGHEAQDILMRLDLAGIAASSGSACRSRAMERSYVIAALGYHTERANSSMRFSFGRGTTRAELAKTAGVLKKILA